MRRDDSELHTFLFADLAGFTALTEAHGDERAADLVADFSAAVEGLLNEYRAEQVKTMREIGSAARSTSRRACRVPRPAVRFC